MDKIKFYEKKIDVLKKALDKIWGIAGDDDYAKRKLADIRSICHTTDNKLTHIEEINS